MRRVHPPRNWKRDPAAPAARAGGRPAVRSNEKAATGYSPREILLAAAARAVLAAFRESLEQRSLPAPATATLRVLETALEPYFPDSPHHPADRRDK